MCTTTFGTLTLAVMLKDPLIQAVMRSDGVSDGEHAELLFRVKDTLAERWTHLEPEPRSLMMAELDPAIEKVMG